ncbi:MAG: IS66 family transposase [Holdemanella porci]
MLKTANGIYHKETKEELKPKFEKFLSWLEEIEPRNKGKYSMSKAIQYVLNNKEGLMEFTNDAIIPHDNTSSERSIRPFVVITRNRLPNSAYSVHGASSECHNLFISNQLYRK